MSIILAPAEPSIAGVGDYIALMKSRVMSLPARLHPVIGLTALRFSF